MSRLLPFPKKSSQNSKIYILILLSLVWVVTLSCALLASDEAASLEQPQGVDLQASQAARAVESDRATLQAQQTELALQATDISLAATEGVQATKAALRVQSELEATEEALQATIDAQEQATEDALAAEAQPTATPTEQAPAETPTPEGPPRGLFTTIPLVDWQKSLFIETNDCRESNLPCWKTAGSAKKEEVSLFSRNEIFIDPEWPNPHLVFWHTHNFVETAYIYLQVLSATGSGSRWDTLRVYGSTQKQGWYMESIDLSEYQGETIKIQFYTGVRADWFKTDVELPDWSLQDIHIDPEFSAP